MKGKNMIRVKTPRSSKVLDFLKWEELKVIAKAWGIINIRRKRRVEITLEIVRRAKKHDNKIEKRRKESEEGAEEVGSHSESVVWGMK